MIDYSYLSPESLCRKFVSPIGHGALVNLDDEARVWLAAEGLEGQAKNPLLDPMQCARFADWVARKYGAEWTFGGYGENRSLLWRGSYLDAVQGAIHLGIDINVPAGTPVKPAVDGTVLWRDDDTPDNHGWGPRLFIAVKRQPDIVMVYAHLSQVAVNVGARVSSSQEIAKVGAPPMNGNWFPHLHVQALQREYFEANQDSHLKELDGYCPMSDVEKWKKRCPDPFTVIGGIKEL